MAIVTLKDRVNSYQECYSQKIMPRLPVVISLVGRSFDRVTSKLTKPYALDLTNVMCATAIKLCHEVEGTVFAYVFYDDITLVVRNDQTNDTKPWFQNDIQSIVSVSASIATLEFNNAARSTELPLLGDATFVSSVFAVPNLGEAANVIVCKQQLAQHRALTGAVMHKLTEKFGDDAIDILQNRSADEKEELLREYGSDFSSYPQPYRRGIACYRAPVAVNSKDGQIFKKKWILNNELPFFAKDQSFLTNIFKIGSDIVRANELENVR